MKQWYVFFLTAGIIGVIIVLLYHATQLTQVQQDILSATLGGLLMALQSCVHSIYQGTEPNPTPPASPAGASK